MRANRQEVLQTVLTCVDSACLHFYAACYLAIRTSVDMQTQPFDFLDEDLPIRKKSLYSVYTSTLLESLGNKRLSVLVDSVDICLHFYCFFRRKPCLN